MVIADAIRQADTEHVVYFLLCAYVNSATRSDTLKNLPERIVTLPLAGKDDVKSRFATLMYELDAASKQLDDIACLALKDALTVFSAAVQRLQSLDIKRFRTSRVAGANATGAGVTSMEGAPPYAYAGAAGPDSKASTQA